MDAKRKGPRGSIGTRPQKPSGGRDSENKGHHGSKPDAMRDKAILSLLGEKTIGTAALQCGVNERTLRRWLIEDATFKAEYDTARTATFQAGINRVVGLTTKAADTLEVLLDAEKHPTVRLGAARTVVEIGMNRHDAGTILRTLDEIEQRQQSGRH